MAENMGLSVYCNCRRSGNPRPDRTCLDVRMCWLLARSLRLFPKSPVGFGTSGHCGLRSLCFSFPPVTSTQSLRTAALPYSFSKYLPGTHSTTLALEPRFFHAFVCTRNCGHRHWRRHAAHRVWAKRHRAAAHHWCPPAVLTGTGRVGERV